MLPAAVLQPSCSLVRAAACHKVIAQTCRSRTGSLSRAEPDSKAYRSNVERIEEEFVGLSPEDDWEVPGGPNDSLSQNTKLGQAVHNACLELDALSVLEQENLMKANVLLKQMGYKGDLFQTDTDQGQEDRQ